MRAFLVALLLVASPAMAEECRYVAEDGATIAFLDNGENQLTITRAGKNETCTWARSEEGSGTRISCDAVADFWTNAGPAGDERSAATFDGVTYRRACS